MAQIPSLTSTGLYPIAKELSEISDLNSGALNFNISENSGQSSIAVNCSFDNTPFYDGSNAFFDYNISFNTNELTSQTNTVVNGAINVLGSNRKDKLRIALYPDGMLSYHPYSNSDDSMLLFL